MLGNFILSWESEDIGLSTNLIYTYTGEYLTVASLGFVGQPDSALPNEIRKPFHSLDWNISKKWESSWADYKVKFQVRNILDSDVEVFYEGLASTIAPAEAVSPGREFGLSLEAKF
jgi:outer membrane receptor protein involved in Fe transport